MRPPFGQHLELRGCLYSPDCVSPGGLRRSGQLFGCDTQDVSDGPHQGRRGLLGLAGAVGVGGWTAYRQLATGVSEGCSVTVNSQTFTWATDQASNAAVITVFGRGDIRITSIDGFSIDVVPQGRVIVSRHVDKPGIIGSVGEILGSHSINIAGMHVGRKGKGEFAVMVLSVDDPVPPEVMDKIRSIKGLDSVKLVEF